MFCLSKVLHTSLCDDKHKEKLCQKLSSSGNIIRGESLVAERRELHQRVYLSLNRSTDMYVCKSLFKHGKSSVKLKLSIDAPTLLITDGGQLSIVRW